jgi:hypothetical protein
MEKTAIEKQFGALVSCIWTHFKPLGYIKKGNNFRFYDTDSGLGKILNFQKSAYGDKNNIRFTINAGLYLAEFEFYLCGKRSCEKFLEHECAIRKRTGDFTNGCDSWYELNDNTDIETLTKTVEKDVVRYVIPFLKKVKTKEDFITTLIIEGSQYKSAYVKFLYSNGQKERAFNVLQQEYRTATPEGKKLWDKTKDELEILK